MKANAIQGVTPLVLAWMRFCPAHSPNTHTPTPRPPASSAAFRTLHNVWLHILQVMKEWIAKRVTQLLGGLEEEVLIGMVYNFLEDPEVGSAPECSCPPTLGAHPYGFGMGWQCMHSCCLRTYTA